MKSLSSLIAIFTATLVSFSTLAYEEYTVSSVDADTGTQIRIQHINSRNNAQSITLLGDPDSINLLPTIAQSENNQLITVWQHFGDGNSELYFSTGVAGSWSKAQKINTEMRVNVSPFVVKLGMQVVLFWSATVEDRDLIFYALFNEGKWSEPEQLPGQTLPINILPRVTSEQKNHFVEWLASSPTTEYSIQRYQLNVPILDKLSSARNMPSSAKSASLTASAFAKRPVVRAPVVQGAASVDAPHTRFSLKIENGKSQHKARKILQY